MNTVTTEGFEVPAAYHLDLLQAMPVDAHTLHVYWEVSNRKKWMAARHMMCDWQTLTKVLRVHDVTAIHFNGINANGSLDIPLTPEANNWCVKGLHPNTTYIVDLGFYTYELQFIPLLRSHAVNTHRDYPAAYGEPIVAVYEDVGSSRPNHRLQPHFHENFHIFEEFNK